MILIYMMVLCTQVNKMYVIATLSTTDLSERSSVLGHQVATQNNVGRKQYWLYLATLTLTLTPTPTPTLTLTLEVKTFSVKTI